MNSFLKLFQISLFSCYHAGKNGKLYYEGIDNLVFTQQYKYQPKKTQLYYFPVDSHRSCSAKKSLHASQCEDFKIYNNARRHSLESLLRVKNIKL